jgi:hypothetical protein
MDHQDVYDVRTCTDLRNIELCNYDIQVKTCATRVRYVLLSTSRAQNSTIAGSDRLQHNTIETTEAGRAHNGRVVGSARGQLDMPHTCCTSFHLDVIIAEFYIS